VNGRASLTHSHAAKTTTLFSTPSFKARQISQSPRGQPRQDFVSVCSNLSPQIKCHVLVRRSIENYFTDAAVNAVRGASALGHYDRAPKPWKVDNWRIAEQMTRADIDTTDLGQFLASI
jgi:hypothetical protein